ncbi:hypothetical protein QQS21_007505 [Conoideocrella luteorostrata]|uniref:Uncharacterized protein n=1 Tax=Conoideocrella luteorostrata TaxID=1105319 RepID=A0AAJ0CKJ6_9HYPO|nr:hypothetical protein QQS21_007505 [Conoideocrella luteorostrata]
MKTSTTLFALALAIGAMAQEKSPVMTGPPLHSFPPIASSTDIPSGTLPTTLGTAVTGTSSSDAGAATTKSGTAGSSSSTAMAVPTGQVNIGGVLGIAAALLAL